MNKKTIYIISLASILLLSSGLAAMELKKREDSVKFPGIYFSSPIPYTGEDIPESWEKSKSSRKRYLEVTLWTGLANRLRVIGAALIASSYTNRKLIVDWQIVPDEMPGAWCDFFMEDSRFDFEQTSLDEDRGYSLEDIQKAPLGHPVIKNLGSQNSEAGLQRLQKLAEDQERIVYFSTSLYFRLTKICSPVFFRSLRQLFYKNLVPVERISQAVKKFKEDNEFDKKYMIGVHYRSWATGQPDDKSSCLIKDPNLKYLDLFIDKMKESVASPLFDCENKPVAFFLATDDPLVKDKLLAHPDLKGRIVTTSHVIDRSSIEGTQNGLIDFFLLGATNYNWYLPEFIF